MMQVESKIAMREKKERWKEVKEGRESRAYTYTVYN